MIARSGLVARRETMPKFMSARRTNRSEVMSPREIPPNVARYDPVMCQDECRKENR